MRLLPSRFLRHASDTRTRYDGLIGKWGEHNRGDRPRLSGQRRTGDTPTELVYELPSAANSAKEQSWAGSAQNSRMRTGPLFLRGRKDFPRLMSAGKRAAKRKMFLDFPLRESGKRALIRCLIVRQGGFAVVSDLIPMRMMSRKSRVVAPTPDVAVTAIPLFQQLRDTLFDAGRFLENRAKRAARSSRIWNEPPLFFFQHPQSAASPRSRMQPKPQSDHTSHAYSAGSAAWSALPDLIDDALSVLASSVTARHAARAVSGLMTVVESLKSDHPRIQQLADVLAVHDDAVLMVAHPAARVGVRVVVHGIADIGQLHILLAAVLRGDPADLRVPGAQPDSHIVAASQDGFIGSDPIVESYFQLYQAAALTPIGTLPQGFAGVQHWLWPQDTLADIPRVQGERILFLGEPVYPMSWSAARRVPLVRGNVTVLERYSPAQITHWLETRTGCSLPNSRTHQAA